eukprot:8860528-Alexandrium_andersonii.AAC.1
MSASLVGSEMCIRDSHHTEVPLRARQPCSQGAMPHPMGQSGDGSPRTCSCLLYTSDAADDM